MRRSNVLNSPRLTDLKRRRRKAFLNKILFFLGSIAVVVGVFFYALRIDKLNISVVTVEGNKIIDSTNIEKVVKEQMVGNYLLIVPKTNIFFYPKNKIKEALYKNFKRLTNIEVSLGNSASLEVSVSERLPKYTWCGDEYASEKTNKSCYFMDEGGYIFDVAPYFSGDVYFRFYGIVTENDDPTGEYFFKDNFANILKIESLMEEQGIKPISIYVKEEREVRMQLSQKAGGTNPEILFNIDSDPEKITENLQSILSTEPMQTDFKKKYASLLYIDLRFGNKVYYKFK